MATSTNYLWTEPNDSDLVKNGASAIRTLGNAIDASLWSSGFGQAGKNKIINGNMAINQRSFTSNTTSSAFNFDRFLQGNSGGTVTVTPQTFTTGTAPVAGYEAKNYVQVDVTGQSAAGDYAQYYQRIEDVRTFAGQTATFSFWAKASSGTPKIAVEARQSFGTGGSPSSTVTNYAGQVTISTTWTRYSVTLAVPSISGKTIGTNNDSSLDIALWVSAGTNFAARTGSIGTQTATFQIWGIQAEYGPTATPFQTASGGSPQAELAMCQRYYTRYTVATTYGMLPPKGYAVSGTTIYADARFVTTMRTAPTAVEYGGNIRVVSTTDVGTAITNYTLGGASPNNNAGSIVVASGLTTGGTYQMQANNDATAYVAFTAELQEMTMDKVTFITVIESGGIEVEHAIIDRGNGEFTSMLKAIYDELKANEAKTK